MHHDGAIVLCVRACPDRICFLGGRCPEAAIKVGKCWASQLGIESYRLAVTLFVTAIKLVGQTPLGS